MEFLSAYYGIILQIILKKQGFTLLTYGTAKDSFLWIWYWNFGSHTSEEQLSA